MTGSGHIMMPDMSIVIRAGQLARTVENDSRCAATDQVRVDEHIVHLLLVATEASLWTAERFAEDLKVMLNTVSATGT